MSNNPISRKNGVLPSI